MVVKGIAVEITDYGFEIDYTGEKVLLPTLAEVYQFINAIKPE